MSDEIVRINSITQLHQMFGWEKPKHPLVSVLDVANLKSMNNWVGVKMTSDLYVITLKDHDCGMLYGRSHYDFEEGVLAFYEPGQVVTQTEEINEEEQSGWMLFFHPDLLRKSALGRKIQEYSFFSYGVNEALHLSDQERRMLYDTVSKIEFEYNQNIDGHTQELIVNNIELLLNYSNRFYERQFHTRTNTHKDVVIQFETLLKAYMSSDKLVNEGIPSVAYFADQVHLSGNYLSDLLKKETGKNVKDHVNNLLIDKAKTMLLSSGDTVSEISYKLGFNYPHYFTRMFKLHTGQTPNDYRTIN
ncbi:MAG: AraC family transcriptional regulator [Crocinitomicaceae bacterium]|nr:AraC family transcriptional regulator [Crocinitomicaceae bacterium]